MTSIFEETQVPSDQTGTEEGVTAVNELLLGITNDEGQPKYATTEAALASIPNAQNHISNLERENNELREKVATAKTSAEYADELLSQGQQTVDSKTGLSETEVNSIIENQLSQRAVVATRSQNLSAVNEALVDKFGDKAKDTLTMKGHELGLTIEGIEELAATSPRVVMNWFSEIKPSVTKTPQSNTVTLAQDTSYKAPVEHKSIMGGSSTKDVLDAWRRAAPEQT